jgi:hypothetical protein
MAVAWNRVRNHLAATLPGVVGPSIATYNGPVVTGDSPNSFLTIGTAPSASDTISGTFEQDVGPDGYSATERGAVVCELAAVTGSTDIPDVFTTFDAIAAYVQSDMTLGGTLTPGSTVSAIATVVEAQTTAGAVQRLLITINYFTRL